MERAGVRVVTLVGAYVHVQCESGRGERRRDTPAPKGRLEGGRENGKLMVYLPYKSSTYVHHIISYTSH